MSLLVKLSILYVLRLILAFLAFASCTTGHPAKVAEWPLHGDGGEKLSLHGRHEAMRFGPKGSILTEGDCDRAGGRFVPQLFGWMMHATSSVGRREKSGCIDTH